MIERREGRSGAERFVIRDGYRIVPLAEQDGIDRHDVIAFWGREDVLDPEERERRSHELHMLALTEDGSLAGVSSAYLATQAQLGMSVWHYRVFVAREHRKSGLMIWLARQGRKDLSARFVAREDVRAGAVVFEMEATGVERAFPQAFWYPSGVTYVGLNARGQRIRVHYFPGALAPDPPR